jgi:GTP-binding protein
VSKSKNIRNIAIIAHVDHGKTTIVDRMLQASETVTTTVSERVMDSGALEKERGITILAKNTGIIYGDYIINIVDTPGHADFGGEVERTLQMVEGFLLLVDAAEGVLPGTRFVLQKALQLSLRPIVLINKIDRPDADVAATQSQIHDLFLDLATDDSQLEFPILYGSGKHSFVGSDPAARSGTMQPLLDAIVQHIPAPHTETDVLQILVTSLDHSDFLGPIAIGRVFSGSVKTGDQIILCKDGTVSAPTKITKIFTFHGLTRQETPEVVYGDIVAVTGFDKAPTIGTTLCAVGHPAPHAYVKIDEPTLSMYFSVNDSPFAGREGTFLTSRNLKDRLTKELRTNVALRVEETDSPETVKVSGRGQLHLGILIETMRREGFELQVSAPEVIYKTIDGEKCEPIEHVVIDVPIEHQGIVMETMGNRKAIMKNVTPLPGDRMRIEYHVPSRALLGFRNQFLTDTRGTGVVTMRFYGYEPYKGDIPTRSKGALVSMDAGSATGYALDALQPRGVLFIKPGAPVYEGLIIGEHSRGNDLSVNPCKEKKLTNMRASGTDDAIKLAPPRVMDLETCIEWIRPDELIEVTPVAIRLRKKVLKSSQRK